MTPETAAKKQIRDYLSFMGWFNFPILQGMGAYKGIPDIIACKDGMVLFLEVKAPTGRQSPHQVEFERRLKDVGGHYVLARSWGDVSKYIKEGTNEHTQKN